MLSHLSSFSTLGSTGKFLQFVVVDATTWFIFISGYLFSHLEKKRDFDYAYYLWKKIKFVVTPYLILSIPAIIAGLYFQRDRLMELSVIEYILWSLSVGGSVVGPMWFIPMVVIFFVLAPLFNLMKNSTLTILAILFLTLSVFSFRPYASANPLLGFIHFAGFYIFGILAHTLGSKTNNLSNSTATIILSTAFTGFMILLLCSGKEFTAPTNYISFTENLGTLNSMQLGKLLLLIFVFLALEKFHNKNHLILSHLAKISFGLFFIHGFYMLIFNRYFSPVLPKNFIQIIIEFVLIVPGSIVTVYILKRILKTKSRYVIGC